MASDDGYFSGEVDPEIADLMGLDDDDGGPSFNALFDEGGEPEPELHDDISRECFCRIEKKWLDKPQPFFMDKDFYKKALSGEGEVSQRLHKTLGAYLNTEDPKEKSVYRTRLINAYWEFSESIAKNIYEDIPEPKKISLRFGAVLPNLLSQEARIILSRVIPGNETGEPVHYVDEWLEKIALGYINPSATDEVRTVKLKSSENIRPQIEKQKGEQQGIIGTIQRKQAALADAEDRLGEAVRSAVEKTPNPDYPGLRGVYSAAQRKALTDINQILRDLQHRDKEITGLFLDLERTSRLLKQLEEKAKNLGETLHVDKSVLVREFGSVRQMAKMCVGRQGNHIPILMKQYFNGDQLNLATRENVIEIMARIEDVDPGIFKRTFKRETSRIVPHVILIPCYGERGICWEPFEKFNRGTSRGRLAVPMYSKNLETAVIQALGDLRWQVAKEKAQHYWMEEGLTGYYYQWFSERKMKGDVKERFVQDYLLWITKESEGTQKLDKEVRGIFWRNMPFTPELREKLRNRGFVYNELYKKDINRSMSDGY